MKSEKRLVFVFFAALALQACGAVNPWSGHAPSPRPATMTSSPATSPAGQEATLTPQNEQALFLNLVEGLVKQQRYGAALAFLDSYVQQQTHPVSRYWLLRGDSLLGLGRHAEADAAYVKLDGTALSAEGANGRGRVAAARLEWRAAAADFHEAVQDNPVNPNFLNNLAFADMHLGQSGTSAAYLRQAHELAPGSALIRNNLIIALTLAGDQRGAEAILAGIADGADREEAKVIVKSALESNKLPMGDRS